MEEEITVLYVDDEPALLEIARLFLEQTGNFRVSTVTSAQDALGSSRIPLFDAIISDYQMPNMDGIAFLKEVRSRYGEIPFILFTGRGREEVVIEAINNGADFYLQKGGDPTAQFAELAHKIRQAVAHKKAELSRIESEKRLADIIDFLPDATFAIDTAGTVISWNHAIGEMTGIPAAEMLGKGNYEYAIPLYGTRRKILIDLVFESDETITRDYAHITRDKGTLIGEKQLSRPMGNVINLMGKASPLYNREGRIVGAIETIRDITQREQDAEQIAQKTKTLSIINNIVMVANQHRTIDDYTKSVLSLTIELLHYDAGGIYLVNPDQKTARIISSKNLDYPFVKEVDNIDIRTPPYDTVFIRGEPVLVDNFAAFLPEAAAVSGFRTVASIPIVSQDRIIGALNVASKKKATLSPDDVGILITIGRELGNALTRIKTELALRENEERLQLLIRHAPVALAMLDRELRYITASNRWNADYHLGDRDLTGQSHLGIFPELTEEIRGVLRRSLTGEIISANEDPFQRQDGTIQWLAWEVRPWYTAGHEIGGIIIFSEDITRRKNAEVELLTSEERLHLAIDASNDGLFDWDMEKGTVYFSPQYFTMLGYAPGELPAAFSTWAGLLHPDDRDLALSVVSEYPKRTRESHALEFRLRAKDGSWKWILSRGKITGRNAEGTPVRMVGTHADITDRKHIEDALRESRAELSSILLGSPVLQFVIDRDHKILSWNKALEAYSSIPAAEMIGTDLQWRAFYPHRRPVLADLLVDNNKDGLLKLYGGKLQPSRYIDGAYEGTDFFPGMGASGTHLSYTAAPIRDAQGKVIGAVETLEDVTERVSATEALRASEEEYRHILENMQDAYIRTDENGTITMVNPSAVRMYGYESVAEMRGIPTASLYAGAEDQRGNLLRKLPMSGGLTDFSGEALKKDGTIFWVSVNAQYIKDPDGRILGTEAIVRDITERKTMEQAIKEANRKLALLNSITRHDITNQLTILEGFSNIAAAEEHDPAIAGYLSRINASAVTIRRQIEFTKTYQNLGIHSPGWVLLGEIVARVARPEVIFSGTCEDTEVFADPMLEKVFFNLFENALRHGGHVTEIHVRCERTPDNLLIIVEDNGTGIPASEKEKIFEKGFGKNTGLGLFLAREILAITGITIRETGTPGKGAKFEIAVPKGQFRSAKQN